MPLAAQRIRLHSSPPPTPRPRRRGAAVLGALAAGAILAICAHGAPAAAQGAQKLPNQVPTAPDGAAPDTPLSEKLDRSGGVLRPPGGVDPEIHVPAPDPDPKTTPVIPPPGSPGGDPNVQPK